MKEYLFDYRRYCDMQILRGTHTMQENDFCLKMAAIGLGKSRNRDNCARDDGDLTEAHVKTCRDTSDTHTGRK